MNFDIKEDVIIGYGKSYASFGEIVQGRLSCGNDFLVTLPVDLWSTCELNCQEITGPSIVNIDGNFDKSKGVAEAILQELGLDQGKRLNIKFTRNIPIGKGLSSSTADMLAVVRAFQEVFGFIVTEKYISRLFSNIEPHDALHYFSCTAYNHRKGVLLKKMNYVPQYIIIGIDAGGTVDTKQYNKKIEYSSDDIQVYDSIYKDLVNGFMDQDDIAIARCATRSTKQHIKRSDNHFIKSIVRKLPDFAPIGILTAHSGTCVGLLYPINEKNDVLMKAEKLAKNFGNIFRVNTLKILI
jgi:uncharacterized protein involved in propanediol utilization